MPSGTVINSVEDTVAVILKIIETAKHDIVFLLPPSLFSIAGTYNTVQRAKPFIDKGGVLRGITVISRENIEEVRMRLDIGVDMRHSDHVHEVFMVVGDKQSSVSVLNIGAEAYTLETPVVAYWSEDPTYAEYLLASFETAWSQAVPAEERIQVLLEQRYQRADQ
ncbi:MAG: hypothetical protein LUP95_02850 [Euryarchaeota archaeon]|nr:hypothetical protein [Euryarchaeota archaeon]